MPTTQHTHKQIERGRYVNPLALLISTIREVGDKGEREHKTIFTQLLANPEYEEFRDAIIDEWIRIKYSTAVAAANPPTPAQLRQNLDVAKAKVVEERRVVDAMKTKIKGRILRLMMPNGKRLEDCTGAECVEFGGWYTAIGEYVGPYNLVGKVMKERDVLRLVARQ